MSNPETPSRTRTSIPWASASIPLYRWKRQFTDSGLQELRELRLLRHENSKSKQVVADLTLDRHILQDIVRKKL